MIERNQFLEPPPVVRPKSKIPDFAVVPETPPVRLALESNDR